MKSSRRIRSFSSSTSASYFFRNDHSTPGSETKTTQIPVSSDHPPNSSPVPITVHLSQPPEISAAVKIQSAYRSRTVRTLVRKIAAVKSEADHFERLIQRQETVDAVRSSGRERIRINEALMALLLRLDSVPGLDPSVRELRRSVSRRIVGLQEILDGIANTRTENWDGFLREWDDVVAGIEVEVCRERSGGRDYYEMERFCAENLGFRCLQRFLSEQ